MRDFEIYRRNANAIAVINMSPIVRNAKKSNPDILCRSFLFDGKSPSHRMEGEKSFNKLMFVRQFLQEFVSLSEGSGRIQDHRVPCDPVINKD